MEAGLQFIVLGLEPQTPWKMPAYWWRAPAINTVDAAGDRVDSITMTTSGRVVASALVALPMVLLVACGEDEPYPVASGLYQLTTASVNSTCKLDNAMGPGPALVGQTLPVAITSSAVAINVVVCGHPDASAACGGSGNAFDYGLSRDGNTVVGSQLWGAPGCGDPTVEPTLTVGGEVTDVDTLSIVWTTTITSQDPEWTCGDYRLCSGTVEQRLAPIDPSP